MSVQARSTAQSAAEAVSGNNARKLNSSAPETAAPLPRRRTPLVLVPSRVSKRRTPFVVFCFFTLVAALGSVLVLNVSVSSGQYRLVELNNRQVALAQGNEMLTQRLKNHEAPQNLAAAATELGMVAAPSFGVIDLEAGKISGDPKAAAKTDGADALVPAPEVAIGKVPPVPTVETEEPASEPEAAVDQDSAGEPDARPAGDDRASGEAASEESKPDPNLVPEPVKPEPVDLNGGTIPAPQQQGSN